MASFDKNWFDDLIFSKMSETKIPSVAFAVVEGGEVVHARGLGFRDVAGALPATTQTLYGIGSITKSFVAIAIARLAEAGKLDFHDPVTKFLPLKQKAFEGVELHHLLSHSSGIPGLGALEVLLFQAFGDFHDWLPLTGMNEMASFLDGVDGWKEAKPGEKYFYLNEGFFLLGEVVSRVTGKPWDRYLAEEVFGPLKMPRTFVQRSDIADDPDLATPYAVRGLKVKPTAVPYGSSAAGGIMSCAADMSNYLRMLIGGGELDGKRIVEKATLEKMESSYVKTPADYYGGDSYGYGLRVIPDFHGHKVVGHGGSVDVYTSNMEYVRDTKSGVVLLANGTGYSLGVLAMCAISKFLGADPSELGPVKTETLLKKVEGQYKTYKDTIYAEVKRNGSFLMLSGEDIGKDIVLVPDGQDKEGARFFTLDGGARMDVTFRFNEHGVELLFERYRYRRVGPLPVQRESQWQS